MAAGRVTETGSRGDVRFRCTLIANATTATGATDHADVTGCSRITILADNGATNTATFTVQGSLDGTNWHTIAYRVDSSASYVLTGLSVTGSSKSVAHLSPTEYVRFLRVNLSAANANGTSIYVYCET
jgi:hypothetical protein